MVQSPEVFEEEDRIKDMFAQLRRKDVNDRYEWHSNPGFNFTKHSAEVIAEHLLKLAGDNGDNLHTKMIVDDAHDPSSPLHPLFEHDVEIAASKWWYVTARSIANSLRLVKVTIVNEERIEQRVPGFINLMVDKRYTYVPVRVVARTPHMKDQAIDRLISEAKSFAHKAKELGLFARAVEAIDEELIRLVDIDDSVMSDEEILEMLDDAKEIE